MCVGHRGPTVDFLRFVFTLSPCQEGLQAVTWLTLTEGSGDKGGEENCECVRDSQFDGGTVGRSHRMEFRFSGTKSFKHIMC